MKHKNKNVKKYSSRFSLVTNINLQDRLYPSLDQKDTERIQSGKDLGSEQLHAEQKVLS